MHMPRAGQIVQQEYKGTLPRLTMTARRTEPGNALVRYSSAGKNDWDGTDGHRAGGPTERALVVVLLTGSWWRGVLTASRA